MSGGTFRPQRMVPLLQAIAERGPVGQLALSQVTHWRLETVQKTLENALTFGYALHDGKRRREEKQWSLSRAGWAKIGREPVDRSPEQAARMAVDSVPRVVNSEHARALALTMTATNPTAPSEPPTTALPSIDLAAVQHLPVREVDIDAIHRKRQAGAPAPSVAAAESDFLCALYSDGRLIIETHGARCVLPAAHVRQLLRFLEPYVMSEDFQ